MFLSYEIRHDRDKIRHRKIFCNIHKTTAIDTYHYLMLTIHTFPYSVLNCTAISSLWPLDLFVRTSMMAFSSVPKPFIAFRSTSASCRGLKGVTGFTVGVPWKHYTDLDILGYHDGINIILTGLMGPGWRRGQGAALLVGRSRGRLPVVSLDLSVTYSFQPYHGPGVDSAPSENEYQGHFPGGKGGRCVRLTSPPSCAECHGNLGV